MYGTPYGEAPSYVAAVSLTDDASVTYELTVRLKTPGERALTAELTPKVATWARKQPLQRPPVSKAYTKYGLEFPRSGCPVPQPLTPELTSVSSPNRPGSAQNHRGRISDLSVHVIF